MQCVSQGQATQHHQTIMDCLFVCLLCVVAVVYSPSNMQCVSQGQATQQHQTIMDCLFVCRMLLLLPKVLAMQCVSQGQTC